MAKTIGFIIAFLGVIVVPYLFFAYINKTLNPMDFGVASRVIMGLWVLMVILRSIKIWLED